MSLNQEITTGRYIAKLERRISQLEREIGHLEAELARANDFIVHNIRGRK